MKKLHNETKKEESQTGLKNPCKKMAKEFYVELLNLVKYPSKIQEELANTTYNLFDEYVNECSSVDQIDKYLPKGNEIIKQFLISQKNYIEYIATSLPFGNDKELYIKPLYEALFKVYLALKSKFLDDVFFKYPKMEDVIPVYMQHDVKDYLMKAWIEGFDDGSIIYIDGTFPLNFEVKKDALEIIYDAASEDIVDLVEKNIAELGYNI